MVKVDLYHACFYMIVQVKQAKISDATIAILQSYLTTNLGLYLGAADKKEMCSQRVTDKDVNAQYYAYKY